MSIDLSVMMGLGLSAIIFTVFSLRFLDSEDVLVSLIGQGMFGLAMIFVLLIVNTVFLVITNDATIAFLNEPVGLMALQATYYFMIIGIGVYFVSFLRVVYRLVIDAIKQAAGARGKGKVGGNG